MAALRDDTALGVRGCLRGRWLGRTRWWHVLIKWCTTARALDLV